MTITVFFLSGIALSLTMHEIADFALFADTNRNKISEVENF